MSDYLKVGDRVKYVGPIYNRSVFKMNPKCIIVYVDKTSSILPYRIEDIEGNYFWVGKYDIEKISNFQIMPIYGL